MTLSFDRLVPPQARCRWARIRAQDASGAKGRSLYCQPRRKPDANPDATPHVDLGEAHGKGGAGVLAAVASIVLGHAADAADAAGASRKLHVFSQRLPIDVPQLGAARSLGQPVLPRLVKVGWPLSWPAQ